MRPADCRIVELRRYALKPGARDTLVELFDREFVESQEELEMCILGQFRDLDDPDSFVWLRGFGDMESRRAALEAFYTGPVWKQHAQAANATMVDVDNVLLLQPVASVDLDPGLRPAVGSTAEQHGLVVVSVYHLLCRPDLFVEFFARAVEPELRARGLPALATFLSEHSENTFPALPVREDEEVFVWLTICADAEDQATRFAGLDELDGFSALLDGPPEVLRLRPTARSLLHG